MANSYSLLSTITRVFTVSLDKTCYYPNETIRLSYSVDNSRSQIDIKSARCQLKQRIMVFDNYNKVKTFTFVLHSQEAGSVVRGEIEESTFEIHLSKIFPGFNDSSQEQFVPHFNGAAI